MSPARSGNLRAFVFFYQCWCYRHPDNLWFVHGFQWSELRSSFYRLRCHPALLPFKFLESFLQCEEGYMIWMSEWRGLGKSHSRERTIQNQTFCFSERKRRPLSLHFYCCLFFYYNSCESTYSHVQFFCSLLLKLPPHIWSLRWNESCLCSLF